MTFEYLYHGFLFGAEIKRFSDKIILLISTIGTLSNKDERMVAMVCFPTPGVPESIIFKILLPLSHILNFLNIRG